MNGVNAATLFQRADNIKAGRASADPLSEGWRQEDVAMYAAGSAGPTDADDPWTRDGRLWLSLNGKGVRCQHLMKSIHEV